MRTGLPAQYGLLLLLAISVAQAATIELEHQGFLLQLDNSGAQKLDLDWRTIDRLYAARGEPSIWHDGETLNAQGERLQTWLADAGAEGLNPADYHVNLLRTLQRHPGAGDSLLRELLLTDGYLRLARDLRQGSRRAQGLDPFPAAVDDDFDAVRRLLEALDRDSLPALLEGFAPASPAYRRLRLALARYRDIEEAGGWPRIDSDTTLRPGQWNPAVAQLRRRLAIESDHPLEAVLDPSVFDTGLEQALRRFQARYGLRVDGLAGRETLQTLNLPVARRIDQLRANLERWRWLYPLQTDEYLLVNTAGFQISMFSRGRERFRGRTVNGSEERPTPELVDRVTHLVANPYWTVPRRIAVEDMLPQQQADPGYLASKQIRAYRRQGDDWEAFDPAGIDWSPYNADNFPFVLRQDAGNGNSLGRVKFHMPNAHAVYLHDTPAVGLFERSQRAFSSGCVRVEGAMRLAQLLLERAEPQEAERFNRALRSGETLVSPLERPMPVFLVYFTSWVDETGEVNFRPDIYHRDADLMLALGGETGSLTLQDQAAYQAPPL